MAEDSQKVCLRFHILLSNLDFVEKTLFTASRKYPKFHSSILEAKYECEDSE